MSAMLLTITLIISLINESNSQISCTNANEATTTAGNLIIYSALCADDNMIYIDITYADYNNNWFGVVFSENMFGDALIYTTGKSDETTRSEALYAYVNAAASSRANGVIYQPNDNWIEHFTDNTNGIRVIYKKSLSNTPWDTSTSNIKIGYAIGSGLTLDYHGHGLTYRNDGGSPSILAFTSTAATDSPDTTSTPTTGSPTTTTTTTTTTVTGSKGCDIQNLVPATTIMDDFTITLFINCDDNTVTITIKYSHYNNNWFGIVFSNNMLGNALIYTTGKSDEDIRGEGLYPYTLNGRNINDVIYSGAENDWRQIKATDENGIFVVEYTQNLDKTSFTRQTETVPITWAKGNSLTLSKHDTPDGRGGEQTHNLDLLSGEVTTITTDLSLETAHGIIMWITWAVLASIGIMSSAFKYLYPNGPKWFYVHRSVQIMVVILDIIGFIIAVVFTEQKGKTHFDDSHMIIGLVVTILCVLQPMNALCRVHPPDNGWPNNVKPIGRIVWEYVHKIFGYSAWILGCVTACLGMQLLGKDLLSYVHIFGWCGLLLIVYVVLFVIGYNKAKLDKQMVSVNDGPGGDIKAREKLVGNESP